MCMCTYDLVSLLAPLCLLHLLQLVAPNTTAYDAPQSAGLPMGTPGSQYLALELHYNNPEGLTGEWLFNTLLLWRQLLHKAVGKK